MKKRTKKLIYNIIVCLLIVVGLVWVSLKFIHWGYAEHTDNAQVKQLIVPVNSRVQGFVSKVFFDEYQEVKKGDTLALIEDTEFRFRLAQAEANYQNAITGRSVMASTLNTTANNIAVSDAAIVEAKIRLENSEREYIRYKNLYELESVTQQQYDAVQTNYEASKARYELMKREKQSTSLVKVEQSGRLHQTEASIKLAEAALELAKLNLSYTIITAPCDGTTGRKNIQEGLLIQPGQTVVDLVDNNDKWVMANFKETQTAHIAPGQLVDLKVDAIPNTTYKGVVRAISRATGASYSIMPQDNSAGNFIKVEQRLPIRIEFTTENSRDDLAKLSAGLNVECFVNY